LAHSCASGEWLSDFEPRDVNSREIDFMASPCQRENA
jgi:hypothetical protein